MRKLSQQQSIYDRIGKLTVRILIDHKLYPSVDEIPVSASPPLARSRNYIRYEYTYLLEYPSDAQIEVIGDKEKDRGRFCTAEQAGIRGGRRGCG